MTREKLLELCDYLECNDASLEAQCEAAAFIRKALAQPEQEPVAVVETIGGYPDESAHVAKWLVPYKSLKAGDKLYTTQPQRKPLTDEQIDKLDCVYALWDDGERCTIMGIKDFARAIEAAHSIKGDA